MVNCLVVFSIFIYEPDTIESVHFAVVADPKCSARLIRPRTACLASHRNYRARRNRDRKSIFPLRLGELQPQFKFLFHTGHSASPSLSGLSIFHQCRNTDKALINAVTAKVGCSTNLSGLPGVGPTC